MFNIQYMIYIFISKAAPCTPISAHTRLRALFLSITKIINITKISNIASMTDIITIKTNSTDLSTQST
jgi:hypothetical protein